MKLKSSFVVLVVGSALIILSPFLVFLIKYTDLNTTGQIGDTIGGITAPIANIVGSILVFLALKAQIEANKIIQDQFQTQQKEESLLKIQQFFLDQFKIIREDIVSFAYIDRKGGAAFRKMSSIMEPDDASFVEIRGAEAFQKTIEMLLKMKDSKKVLTSPKFKEFYTILLAVEDLVLQINASTLERDEKQNIKTLIEYTMQAKVGPAIDYHNDMLSQHATYVDIIPDALNHTYDSIMHQLRKDKVIEY